MTDESDIIPVVLFAYARPDHLRCTLAGLQANAVPLLYIYCDGPKDAAAEPATREVRRLARAVNWCPTRVVERDRNLGLGVSVRTGVTETLARHEMVVVFEDDIECVPGAYAWLAAALRRYRDDTRVMSVAAWTHPKLRPPLPETDAYFDGRFVCWGWGTWRRAWRGMDTPAPALLRQCRRQRRDVCRYGADVPRMAAQEEARNIWAVRFILLHLARGGLCLHPPWSLARHVGYDTQATNATRAGSLEMDALRTAPPIPERWPEPAEHPDLSRLWQAICGAPTTFADTLRAWPRRLRRAGAAWAAPEGIHAWYLRRAVHQAFLPWRDRQFAAALDYGCGRRPYQAELDRVAQTTVGVDIGDNPAADRRLQPDEPLPLPDASMDLVTSFQVLEHVADYRRYLAEASRICKPGGVLLLSAPSIWPYHAHPSDFRRWMLPGLLHDLRAAGFRPVAHWPILNPVSTALQYFLSVCYYLAAPHGRWVQHACVGLACLLNPLIVLSEKTLTATYRLGAGNFLVQAERMEAAAAEDGKEQA